MALDPGVKQRLLAAHPYLPGQVSERHLGACLRDLEEKMNAGQAKPAPQEVKVTDANGTAQTAVVGAGVLYRVRARNTDGDDVIVVVSDGGNNILLAVCTCQGANASGPGDTTVDGVGECDVNGELDGVGVSFATDVRVRAFKKSDGTTAADAGCSVFLLYGTN